MKIFFNKSFLLIFVFTMITIKTSFGQKGIFVYTIEELETIDIIYKTPDFKHPALIVKKTRKRPQGDVKLTNTYNLEKEYVKFSNINSYALSEKKIQNLKQIHKYSKLISKQFLQYIKIDTSIICLFSERYDWSEIGGIDLLIFAERSDRIYLKKIYPESFYSGYYSTPKLIHVNKDTIKVGDLSEDEGSLNGGYTYFTIKNDSVSVFRREVIQGHVYSPVFSSGNPIKGATTKRYHNTYYKEGQKTIAPFYYTSFDENGNQIYGYATGDSLTLHKLGWNHIGDKIEKVRIKNKKIKVGERSYKYSQPFIAIEYDKKWYWIPTNEVEFK